MTDLEKTKQWLDSIKIEYNESIINRYEKPYWKNKNTKKVDSIILENAIYLEVNTNKELKYKDTILDMNPMYDGSLAFIFDSDGVLIEFNTFGE